MTKQKSDKWFQKYIDCDLTLKVKVAIAIDDIREARYVYDILTEYFKKNYGEVFGSSIMYKNQNSYSKTFHINPIRQLDNDLDGLSYDIFTLSKETSKEGLVKISIQYIRDEPGYLNKAYAL